MANESIARSNDAKYDRLFERLDNFSQYLNRKLKLPTLQLAYVLSFVLNFILGKLIHVSAVDEAVYNYYNDKHNFLNQIFVKKGWGWTTIAVLLFYGNLFYRNKNQKVKTTKGKIQLLFRIFINYSIATLWWFLFTQWCFGMPIMDKIFVWTGGKCSSVKEDKLIKHLPGLITTHFRRIEDDLDYESNLINSYTCRKLKGSWVGGHDPSGHVFLMIHSSLYMFFDTLPFWVSLGQIRKNISKLTQQLRTRGGFLNVYNVGAFLLENPQVVIILLISLWWFMLLMTNIYFHSLGEKLVGLIFGYVVNLCVYYLPRYYNTVDCEKRP
ncbi:uncharacterized protein PRCAT00004914001 [Priceomyces carsonii]|uniref:uncharacterized protein n=1 Tax=Priceomyces carsonii TaxID=28549 RepID=UPI002ED801F1|nr:unnamed protein product [Priceomyces carsonii]